MAGAGDAPEAMSEPAAQPVPRPAPRPAAPMPQPAAQPAPALSAGPTPTPAPRPQAPAPQPAGPVEPTLPTPGADGAADAVVEQAPAADPGPAQEPEPTGATVHGPNGEQFDEIAIGQGGHQAAMAFVCDAESARALAGRFETRGIPAIIRPEGVRGATEYLRSSPSPRLLFIDLSAASDPMAEIDALAEYCEPGTTVVSIGSRNDVELFRNLIAAGVTDYLVKPIAVEAIDEALENATDRAAEVDESQLGKLVLFVGAHGGVGTTSLAVNSAWMIAQEQNKKVALVDLDLKFGAVSLALDIEPGRGLREALQNPSRIDSLFVAGAAVSVSDKFYVLGSEEPVEDNVAFEPGSLELLIQELRQSFELVVIDMPREIAVRQQELLADATVVIVSDLSLLGVRDTLRLNGYAKRVIGDGRILTVANRVGGDKRTNVPKADFEKGIENKLDVLVPDDGKTFAAAQHSGKSILAVGKRTKVTTTVRQLCQKIYTPAVAGDGKGKGKGKDKDQAKAASAAPAPGKAASQSEERLPFWRRKKKQA